MKVRGVTWGEQRYSGRIVAKKVDDIPMLDRAMSLARVKNLGCASGMHSEPDGTYDDNVKLVDVARLIGVDLGVTLEMVEHNLDLIASNEKARREMFLAVKGKIWSSGGSY